MPAFALDRAPRRFTPPLLRTIDAPLPIHAEREWRNFGSMLEPRYIIGAGPLDQ
jgi:hypothetical protein